MITISPEIKSTDDLLIWFLGYLAQKFKHHAILKGGMVLRLLNSPRCTNDLDILFVPFTSKKEILPKLQLALSQIQGIESTVSADSKCIRCQIRFGLLQIQIEGTIAKSCEYESISTLNQGTPILLAVQRRDIALSHKISAWNERQLMRDLYDIYFYISVLNTLPNQTTLQTRLKHVYLGRTNRSQAMKMAELIDKLKKCQSTLTPPMLKRELKATLHPIEFPGLDLKIKVALQLLIDHLNRQH
jgi:hypothetical protein